MDGTWIILASMLLVVTIDQSETWRAKVKKLTPRKDRI
jgi:hypothetical protein